MKTFFNPASIAVIGATPREGSLGGQILTNLRYGYTGRLYPVNPNYADIQTLPCYPAVEKFPARWIWPLSLCPPPRCPRRLPPADEKAFGA